MAIGLIFVKESPRYLAQRGHEQRAITNLAYLRKLPVDSDAVRFEMAEIEAAIVEEREARKGLGWKEAFLGKGNAIRFFIAFFVLCEMSFFSRADFASTASRSSSESNESSSLS